jgi:hypothetical protein
LPIAYAIFHQTSVRLPIFRFYVGGRVRAAGYFAAIE